MEVQEKKRIVTIGGGTGQMAVLTGLKAYAETIDITAIVAMADDGGSTGRLRDELGVLPPGDIRKCLIALSDDAGTMRSLFEYRFTQGDLAGHSFGNLFLSALEKVAGSMPRAIEEASHILRVCGTVLPVTTDDTRIAIRTASKKNIIGEKYLDDADFVSNEGVVSTSLTASPTINPHARDALMRADCIVIGPGDIHGSILPCLQVRGMREALANARAAKVLVVNATNKRGLTEHWGARAYLDAIEREIGTGAITHCIANTAEAPAALQQRYAEHEGDGVRVACDALPPSCTPLYTPLLKHYPPHTEAFIRHDEHILAQMLYALTSPSLHV